MGANAEFCFKSKGDKSLDSSRYHQCKLCRHVFTSHSRILIRWLTQRKLSEAVAYLRTSSARNVGADKGQLSAASGSNPDLTKCALRPGRRVLRPPLPGADPIAEQPGFGKGQRRAAARSGAGVSCAPATPIASIKSSGHFCRLFERSIEFLQKFPDFPAEIVIQRRLPLRHVSLGNGSPGLGWNALSSAWQSLDRAG
jgi:hypothetical protein